MQREPRGDLVVPLKGLFPSSDLMPREAYANAGWAEIHSKMVMKSGRRAAFSAFCSGISQGELQTRLQTYELLMTTIVRQRQATSSMPASKELRT